MKNLKQLITETAIRSVLLESLTELGVETCASAADPARWSAGDLATDLAELIFAKLRERTRPPPGQPASAADTKEHRKLSDTIHDG